jgi:hypothetical protein
MTPREPKVTVVVVRLDTSFRFTHNPSSAALNRDADGYACALVVGINSNLPIPSYDRGMNITIAYFDGVLMADEAELYPFTIKEVEKAVRNYCADLVNAATK